MTENSTSAIAEPLAKRPASKRRQLLLVGCALAVTIAAGAAFALRNKGEPGVGASTAASAAPTAKAPTLSVALTTAQSVAWPDALTANGAIAAWQEAVVSSEASGLRLAQVLVDVGAQVRRGQLLALYDDATMRAAVAQQVAAVAETQARLAEAAANAERASRLRSSGAISEQELIQFVTRAQAARAQLDSAQARLQSTRLQLNFTRVLAPDDGVISDRKAMLGAVSAPGSELFRLVRQNRLEWRAELTGAQLASVRIGQPASLRLPDGSEVAGTVRQVAPVLDDRTRTALAYVELERGAASTARAGMYAAGNIVLGERRGMAIPASALVLRDGREMVFVVGADQRAIETKVKSGRRHGNLVEIIDGLPSGAEVVASGGAFLNNGDLVRVIGRVAGNPGAQARATRPAAPSAAATAS